MILDDSTFSHTITFEEETKNNKLYFKITSYKISITPTNAHYHYDNLFNGDQQLSTNTLQVLNDNWKEIYDDVREGVENAYAEIFKAVGNRLFSSVPIQEIFLD